jgi:hypothetical protein
MRVATRGVARRAPDTLNTESVMGLYLFQSDAHIFAVTADQGGAAIPRHEGDESWLLVGTVDEGSLAPDVVATEEARGFCLLDQDDLLGGIVALDQAAAA